MASERLGARENIQFGLKLGLVTATLFSIWAVVVRAAFGPAPFEKMGMSWIGIVLVYYSALSVGGVLFGALLPLKRYAVGAALIGVILVFPAYFGFSVLLNLSREGSALLPTALTDAAVIAVVVGGIFGIWTWMDEP